MRWQRQDGRQPQESVGGGMGVPGRLEKASPGLAAFFSGLGEERTHSVLDLGRASPAALEVYSGFACWIRFADILDQATPLSGEIDAIASGERRYDLIVAWDILDRIPEEDREAVVERLAEISAPGARLFTVVASSRDRGADQRYRLGLVSADRMWLETCGPGRFTPAPLLPAEVQRVLAPFQVVRGFSSDLGIREYYAILPQPQARVPGVPETRSARNRSE